MREGGILKSGCWMLSTDREYSALLDKNGPETGSLLLISGGF